MKLLTTVTFSSDFMLSRYFLHFLIIVTYWRKAEHNMEIVPCSGYKVVIEIVTGWRSAGKFLLHYWNQFLGDFIKLISCKQVGNLKDKQHEDK